jgi:hypothetical protein
MKREYGLNSNPIIPKRLGSKKGVYFIMAKQKNNLPLKIKRIAKVDENGILYIGKTTHSLNTRLNHFKETYYKKSKSKTNSHSGAAILHKSTGLKKYLKECTLFVKISLSNTPDQKEFKLLQSYLNEFGELPPLNSNSSLINSNK